MHKRYSHCNFHFHMLCLAYDILPFLFSSDLLIFDWGTWFSILYAKLVVGVNNGVLVHRAVNKCYILALYLSDNFIGMV